MPHGGMKNPTPAVVHNDETRLIMSGVLVLWVRMSGCKHSHIFSRIHGALHRALSAPGIHTRGNPFIIGCWGVCVTT